VRTTRGLPAASGSTKCVALAAAVVVAASLACPAPPPAHEPHAGAADDAGSSAVPRPDEPSFGACPEPAGPATATRAELTAFLDRGLPDLLGRVRTSPVLDRQGPGARFVGFRIVALGPELRCGPFGLREGDVVTTVNGRSIERPDDALDVWNSLFGATEISLTLVRGGIEQQAVLTIVDEPVRIDNEGVSPATP
jgi:hypothetical protein